MQVRFEVHCSHTQIVVDDVRYRLLFVTRFFVKNLGAVAIGCLILRPLLLHNFIYAKRSNANPMRQRVPRPSIATPQEAMPLLTYRFFVCPPQRDIIRRPSHYL